MISSWCSPQTEAWKSEVTFSGSHIAVLDLGQNLSSLTLGPRLLWEHKWVRCADVAIPKNVSPETYSLGVDFPLFISISLVVYLSLPQTSSSQPHYLPLQCFRDSSAAGGSRRWTDSWDINTLAPRPFGSHLLFCRAAQKEVVTEGCGWWCIVDPLF